MTVRWLGLLKLWPLTFFLVIDNRVKIVQVRLG